MNNSDVNLSGEGTELSSWVAGIGNCCAAPQIISLQQRNCQYMVRLVMGKQKHWKNFMTVSLWAGMKDSSQSWKQLWSQRAQGKSQGHQEEAACRGIKLQPFVLRMPLQ